MKKDPFNKAREKRSKRCVICLESLEGSCVMGLLPCQHHEFCFPCILGWAEVNNKCPLCAKRFPQIQAAKTRGRGLSKGEVLAVPDKEPDNTLDPEFLAFYMAIRCQVCGGQHSEENLLLCDECDCAYHIDCLNMRAIPELEDWYCDNCLKCMPMNHRKFQWLAMHQVGRPLPKRL